MFLRLLNGETTESLIAENEAKEGGDLQDKKVDGVLNAISKKTKKAIKSDKRILVSCADVEAILFGPRNDPEKVYGRRKNRASRHLGPGNGKEELKMVDTEDSDSASDENIKEMADTSDPSQTVVDPEHKQFGGGKVRPAQLDAMVNGSVGGERGWAERKEESTEMLEKRIAGQKKADEREMVRRAARRGCVFGFLISEEAEEASRGQEGTTSSKTDERRRKCEAVMNSRVVEPSYAKGDWSIRWRED